MKMKVPVILIFFLLPGCLCLAQPGIVIKGKVIDRENGIVLPFATVGIPAEYVGTATRPDGSFILKLESRFNSKTLQISAIGYSTKRIPINSLLDNTSLTVELKPKTYQLETVTVVRDRPRTKWIGKKTRPLAGGIYGTAGGDESIGASFAFLVNLETLPAKILYARMFLKEKYSEKLKIRCRLIKEEADTGKPGNPLVPQSVTVTTRKKRGWITCDFRDLDVYMKEDSFFIVFDWLRDPQKDNIAPSFGTAFFFESNPYVRSSALGRWKKDDWASGLIYSLKIEY